MSDFSKYEKIYLFITVSVFNFYLKRASNISSPFVSKENYKVVNTFSENYHNSPSHSS